MANKIGEQADPHVAPQTLQIEQVPNVEQVTGVLPVEGCRYLAAKKIGM
jgi:hypothetical protein